MYFKNLFIIGVLVSFVVQGYASDSNKEKRGKKRPCSSQIMASLEELEFQHQQLCKKAKTIFNIAKNYDPENTFIETITTLERLGIPLEEKEIRKALSNRVDIKRNLFLADWYAKNGEVFKATKTYEKFFAEKNLSDKQIKHNLNSHKNNIKNINIKRKELLNYLPQKKKLIELYVKDHNIEKAKKSYITLLQLFSAKRYRHVYHQCKLEYANFTYTERHNTKYAEHLYHACAGKNPKTKAWQEAYRELARMYYCQGLYWRAEKALWKSLKGLKTIPFQHFQNLKIIYRQWFKANPYQPFWRKDFKRKLEQLPSSLKATDLIKKNRGRKESKYRAL